MASNVQRLGDTLASRMKQTSKAAVPMTVELGKINGNMSLTTDSLMATIPKGEYMVNLILTGDFLTEKEPSTHTHTGSDHSHTGGEHKHYLRGLKPGDRVLVAWCGNEPVVVAVVVSS